MDDKISTLNVGKKSPVLITSIVAVVIIAIIGGVTVYIRHKNNTVTTAAITVAPASTSSTAPVTTTPGTITTPKSQPTVPTNLSDSQLQTDLNTSGTNLATFDNENTAASSGAASQQANLTY